MATNVIPVVRTQLRGVSDAAKELLSVTRRLMTLADGLKETSPEAAAELNAQIEQILKNTNDISKSVETAATLTSNASSTGDSPS
jgi:hypothetical protein